MSNSDIDRLRTIRGTMEHELTWAEAGAQLGISERQIGRLCAKVRVEGNKGVIHGLRGRTSNHQLKTGLAAQAVAIVKLRYWDFKPTFANEKLAAEHGIKVSTSALRAAMIAAGLHKPRERGARQRAWRPRRGCVGELVQLDGSDHDWFEGRGPRCALLVYIDDATSRILHAEFITVEDTDNLLRCTRSYLLANGRPVAFYVDKDSIYKVNRQATIEEELRDSQPLTQFTRAMDELGINVIAAESPQAKGRVERGFHTHQDRMVKELRLRGISTMEAANKFLWEVYVREHNERFAVAPANKLDAHRPLLETHDLDGILSIRAERTLGNDYTVRLKNKFYQVLPEQSVRVRPKAKITMEARLDGTMRLKCKGVYLAFTTLPDRPYSPYYAARRPDKAQPAETPYKPPKTHPWRIWRPAKPAKNAPRQGHLLIT